MHSVVIDGKILENKEELWEGKMSLYKRQEKLLLRYLRCLGRGETCLFADDLPHNVYVELQRIHDTETLWTDVERFLWDNQNRG